MAKKKSSHKKSSQKQQSGAPRGKARDGSRPPWKKKRRGRVGPDGLIEDVVPTRVPPEFTDKSRGERLQKVMADAGVASRRDCETLIRRGRVFVNGKRVAALPAWVDPAHDEIKVEGERIYPSAARDTGRGKGTS
jgi:23S rRNA pseudouridine2605 synthase